MKHTVFALAIFLHFGLFSNAAFAVSGGGATPSVEEAKETVAKARVAEETKIINQASTFCDKPENKCGFTVIGTRVHKRKDYKFPSHLKCTSVDFRTFRGCIEPRFFDPSARVFFDSGSDDDDEIDIFDDGSLNLTVQLASLYFPQRFGISEAYDNWSWGPVIGAGLGQPAKDSEDGSEDASGAPVVLGSAGGPVGDRGGDVLRRMRLFVRGYRLLNAIKNRRRGQLIAITKLQTAVECRQ